MSEMKFVHREETFNDHAVEELSDLRAKCLCRVQFGRCRKKECKACSHGKHFRECYSQLSSYDKARLEAKIGFKYGAYSQNPECWLSYKRLKAYYWRWLFGPLLFFALMLLCAIAANAL